MTAITESLWSRALTAAGARGLLPANKSRLTPGELALEVARRGEDRLMRLVAGWYYPASYGRIDGALSDDEVHRLVASLEAEVLMVQAAPVNTDAPIVEAPPPRRELERCELCGFPLPPKSAQTRPT